MVLTIPEDFEEAALSGVSLPLPRCNVRAEILCRLPLWLTGDRAV
jgi:hypothetical protein